MIDQIIGLGVAVGGGVEGESEEARSTRKKGEWHKEERQMERRNITGQSSWRRVG